MTIIGTIGELPKPVVVANRLHNVKADMATVHFNFGYSYPYRARPVVPQGVDGPAVAGARSSPGRVPADSIAAAIRTSAA